MPYLHKSADNEPKVALQSQLFFDILNPSMKKEDRFSDDL
jgi:hypothetical protein